MHKLFSLPFIGACLVSSFVLSCVSSRTAEENKARAPQALGQITDEEQIRFENSFKATMSATGNTLEEQENTRVRQVEQYFQRQLTYFQLGQGLVSSFDENLEILYQQKVKHLDTEQSSVELDKNRVQLHLAWQLSEGNLHETQYIYERLLSEAHNSSSPLQASAQKALGKINQFFDATWKQGDQWAALSLGQDFESINQKFIQQKPDAKLPKFRNLFQLNGQERDAAYKHHLKNFKKSWRKNLDKDLIERLEARWKEHLSRAPERNTQSDTLYPDSGPNGNITGSHFSPGVWAITLDDGPHPAYTEGMIEAIQSAGLRATFFWLSQNLKLYPALIEKAKEVGFRRGSHYYTHANLPTLQEAGLVHEIDDAGDVFTAKVGERASFFRCPYGACGSNGSRIRQKIAARNMMHVFWNVDSLDWQDKNPASIFARVKKQMEVNGHGIILFHDIHPQSVEAMKLVVAYINSKPDLKTYTMDEIMKLETGADYHSP